MTKKELQEAFNQADAKAVEYYHRILIMQLQELICSQVKLCQDRKKLKRLAWICGAVNGMRFIESGLDGTRYEPDQKGDFA